MNFDKVKKLIDKMAAAQAEVRKNGKVALKEAFQEFFNAVPEAKCIKWNQGIPSFNDGDVCRFSVHELNLFLTKKSLEELLGEKLTKQEYDDRVQEGYDGDQHDLEYSAKATARAKEISKLFEEFSSEVLDEDLFKEVFGEFASVTATPGKFKIEDYESDY